MNLILRGGQVIDGSGARAQRADVGIEGNAVVAIGDLTGAGAERIIDVSGLMVAPGFIDMHSHSDNTLIVDPTADSKVRQGVTTEVTGQCGMGPAPLAVSNKDEFDRFWGRRSAYPLRRPDLFWSSFGDFLGVLRDGGLILNVVPLVGHGPIRSVVMGSSQQAPTDEELSAMKELVAACMREGAWGMSTGLIYAPGIHATTEELIELSRVVAGLGGFYFSHIRGDGATLLEATEEAITIGRQTGIPVEISHVKAAGRSNWGLASIAMEKIERAQQEGLDVTGDMYPYLASSTALSSTVLPLWARGASAGNLFAKPLDAQTRQRLGRDTEVNMHSGGRLWEDIYIARCVERPEIEGLNVVQLAGQQHQEPVEAAIWVLEESKGKATCIAVGMCEENVQMTLSNPTMMIGTDGNCLKPSGPLGVGKLHPRSYGTFPRVLGRYSRELGLFSLEEAVHRMTGLPARKLGLKDRGRLAIGCMADIAVINPGTVVDTATFSDPYRYPIGIEHVLVNGQIAVENGQFTGRLPGKVLER